MADNDTGTADPALLPLPQTPAVGPGVDASIAAQLSALHVMLQFVTRDIHAMQEGYKEMQRRSEEREQRLDDRVARIEQAVEQLKSWQQESLENIDRRRKGRSTLVTGWAVVLFGSILGAVGWLVSFLGTHLRWHP